MQIYKEKLNIIPFCIKKVLFILNLTKINYYFA